jgi:small-conductance mechanosensitive channel
VTRRPDDDDDDGLDRLRQVAVGVFIALSALLAIATVVGRPVSDAFTGLTFGTLLALLGIEGLVRVVRSGRDDQ